MTNSIVNMKERFARLPNDARSAIEEFDYDTALKAIHAKHKFHIDQAAALEKALADVIFGDAKPFELIPRIQNDLRLSPDMAREIAIEVNTAILKPLQDNMRRFQAEHADDAF